jgi:5-methyltetrahydrofolate--homocysteine methyltransferase
MADFEGIAKAILEGQASKVEELVQQAIDEGVPADQIISDGMIKGMAVVGDLFKRDEIFVPEVLVSARAMKKGMTLLEPLLVGGSRKNTGTVLFGTVKGDMHDIGKNLVKMMLEGAGFKVIDLGVNVTPEAFVKGVQDNNPDIICMSALLTTTMASMKETIDALTAAGLRDKVKVMVGGAPVTESYAQKIGADAMASDAGTALDIAKKYVEAA